MSYLRFQIIFIALLHTLLLGCNTYSDHYQVKEIPSKGLDLLQPKEKPKLEHVAFTDMPAEVQQLENNGWVVMGYSIFVTGDLYEDQAIDHAQKIGSKKVLLAWQPYETRNGAAPILVPTSSTSNFSGTTGYGTYQGTSTSYGTQPMYIPFTVNFITIKAVFLTPRKGSSP